MAYPSSGPINCDVDVDISSIKGKTAIVTGGANGIGEQYSRKLAAAGAYVVIGDLDEAGGQKLASEYKGSAEFVKCDVTQWDSQLAMFKKALASSPNKQIDIVVANAGISGDDPVFMSDLSKEDPEKPNLNITNINGIGVLYTVTLALHYFRRQNAQNKPQLRDFSLVLQGSLAGFCDLPGSLQYGFTKFGLRGIMRVLRTTEKKHGIRVNFIGPWFIDTKIMPDDFVTHLKSNGVVLAKAEDSANCLLKIVSDQDIHGRAFAVVPRDWAPRGYVDLEDDHQEGTLLNKMETIVGKATLPLFPSLIG